MLFNTELTPKPQTEPVIDKESLCEAEYENLLQAHFGGSEVKSARSMEIPQVLQNFSSNLLKKKIFNFKFYLFICIIFFTE